MYFYIVKIGRPAYIHDMSELEGGKPYHHGDLYDQLLNAGEQALAELPFEKVSLREIARRAGVSHAAPKHHFPTLGHLLGEIAARGFTKFVKALAEAADTQKDQSPRARVLGMARAYLRFSQTDTEAYRLMFGGVDVATMTPNLIAASYAAWNQLRSEVEKLVGPAHANAAALHVWSSVHGLAMLMLAKRMPPEISLHHVQEQKLQMMMTGLKPE